MGGPTSNAKANPSEHNWLSKAAEYVLKPVAHGQDAHSVMEEVEHVRSSGNKDEFGFDCPEGRSGPDCAHAVWKPCPNECSFKGDCVRGRSCVSRVFRGKVVHRMTQIKTRM